MADHLVITVKAVGRAPEAVADEAQRRLSEVEADGWELRAVQPVVYNSSTTGYLLMFLGR